MKTYEEIYKQVTNEGEKAKYPEAIDGGFGWRPVSGYRVIKSEYPAIKYTAFYETVFNCYDGWDSMREEEPTYIGESKKETILACYIQMKENEIYDLKEKIENLREEFRIVDEACEFWKDEAKTLNKRIKHERETIEEIKLETDMLANENRNMAEYLSKELDHSQDNIDTIANGFWTYRKEGEQ